MKLLSLKWRFTKPRCKDRFHTYTHTSPSPTPFQSRYHMHAYDAPPPIITLPLNLTRPCYSTFACPTLCFTHRNYGMLVHYPSRKPGSSFTGSRRKKPAIEQMSAPKIEKRDISEVYQIFVDDMVGSGQFGAVYGAIQRETGRKAAVKVIKKEQFGQQRRSIENEVKILKCAQYPCIVEMMNTFETDGKLFVVMERMHSDMLEMILSSSQGRLDERTTQLMMIQIMMALKYLHSMDIAHCDLKPENVLLAEDSNMPLIKLCDFGYARIIDQSQFRQSMVGTPAYLAPEVISHANWDRNIDVWAAGVVLYVTLSGTFPFNEEEDICDQIENASFMYPPNPWKQISHDAIELLNCLLVVNPTDRYNVNRCLQHNFLSNKTVLNDLKALETRHNISLAID